MRKLDTPLLALAFAASFSATAFAQEKAVPAQTVATETKTVEMTAGEIRKVDLANKKITIKHGEIRNLDMPPMTMVFGVADSNLLSRVSAGDQVRFSAARINGAFVVTALELIPKR